VRFSIRLANPLETTTNTAMKDLRTLCDEAIQLWDADCDMDGVINEMRTALAQPEPEGPSGEKLTWLWNHLQVSRRQLMALRGKNCLDDTDYQQFAHSVLRQWGRPAIKPVPVAERPWEREGWCDAKGRCWFGAPDRAGAVACWDLEYEPATDDTHSLPHHALPLPQQPS